MTSGYFRKFTVLFIGLGSIGRRHLRLLREMVDVQILWCRSGKGVHPEEFDKENKAHRDSTQTTFKEIKKNL